MEKKSEVEGFGGLGLSEAAIKAVNEMGFEEPTPIQKLAIPPALEGRDLIGQAQTGTGKTASFGIPIIEKDFSGKKPQALIITPTRELALQVSEELRALARFRKCSVVTVYGGASIVEQIKALRQGTNIVVGTPGRIIDHLTRGTMSVENVSTVVLDEADEMLDMGFIADIERILAMTPESRQTMLYSATMPAEIQKIAKRHMRDPVRIAINVKDIVAPEIQQVFYEVLERDKTEVLRRLLDVESPELTLVFCHTKREVDDVAAWLQKIGYNAGALHGDFTQSHREEMMSRFRSGKIDILVATDVAGRGIDIENISHVINYSIPQDPEGYIHRIGRTGRAGRTGIAVTFVTPREYRQLQLIERIAKTKLSKKEIPTAAEVKKARQRQIKEDLAEVIEKGKHRQYMAVIRELAESADIEELGAAALSLAFGSTEIAELVKHQPRPFGDRRPEQRGTGERGMTRLFMTVGHKDKVQTAEVLKAIAKESDIPGHSVGKIEIMDHFTFFEVPSGIAEKVLTAMNRAVIRGRRVSVTKAKAHPASSKTYPKKKRP
ncbi:MAG: DEAD/DEAH box helicase [Nitrospiraceae bacterium]|nr:DEAD/DEAH box helicase [Nitrospiraceae bacterium]